MRIKIDFIDLRFTVNFHVFRRAFLINKKSKKISKNNFSNALAISNLLRETNPLRQVHKKQKNKTYIIVKPILCSVRSESKNWFS